MMLYCVRIYTKLCFHYVCKDQKRTGEKKKHCSERAHFCDAWVSCRNLRQCEKGKIMQASTRLEMVVITDVKYVYFVGTVDDVLFFCSFTFLLQWNDVTCWTGVIQLCSVL